MVETHTQLHGWRMVQVVDQKCPRWWARTDYMLDQTSSSEHILGTDWQLHGPNARKYDHEVELGLGQSPAIPRWGPRFREELELVAYVFWNDDCGVHGRVWFDGEMLDDALIADEALLQLADDGLMYVALMQNQKGLFHQDTEPSSLSLDLSIRGCPRARMGKLVHQYQMSPRRLKLMKMTNVRSCGQQARGQ